MSLATKTSALIRKFEIVLAIFLFFSMLISCGLYINIKMNGKSAALPPLSAADKNILLRASSYDDAEMSANLIEPVFMGMRRYDEMLAALPCDISDIFSDSVMHDTLEVLFSGEAAKVEFSSNDEKKAFIDEIKSMDNYILMSFYCDIPSSVFVPCLIEHYSSFENLFSFRIRNLFIIPDADGNLKGVCFSSDCEAVIVTPQEKLLLNKTLQEAYDVNDNWSTFKFGDALPICPVLTSSFVADDYILESLPDVYGKNIDSELVRFLFEKFSINSNLVKSFTSGNDLEISYVEELNELTISDNGHISYKSGENSGVSLDDYVDFYSENRNNLSFADKIFALKKFISGLNKLSDISFTIIGLDYDDNKAKFRVYFKYVTDGFLVTNNKYDAVFEIDGNFITSVDFYMLVCDKTEENSVVMPQNYANAVLANGDGIFPFDSVFCPILAGDENNSKIKAVKWAEVSFSSKEGN